jgi:hypothetical protein
MRGITTIGLDIAKSVFQVHGIDAEGNVIIRRQLKRRYVLAFFQKLPACVVGLEACASSHHWSRELQALGHTARLMPPVINAIRAHLAEFGIVAPVGRRGLEELLDVIGEAPSAGGSRAGSPRWHYHLTNVCLKVGPLPVAPLLRRMILIKRIGR